MTIELNTKESCESIQHNRQYLVCGILADRQRVWRLYYVNEVFMFVGEHGEPVRGFKDFSLYEQSHMYLLPNKI